MRQKAVSVELTMNEKRKVIKKFSYKYGKESKKGKGRVLDMVVEVTGYNRVYAAYLLRAYSRVMHIRGVESVYRVIVGEGVSKRGRKKVYGEDVCKALIFIWKVSGYMCGKRLAGCIRDYIDALERHGEVEFQEDVKGKLLRISPATIDRILKPERRRLKTKDRHGTKPGSILKREIEAI